MDYKIGDTIRIKPMEWYEDNKDENGIVVCDPQFHTFIKSMNKYCGKNAVIILILEPFTGLMKCLKKNLISKILK